MAGVLDSRHIKVDIKRNATMVLLIIIFKLMDGVGLRFSTRSRRWCSWGKDIGDFLLAHDTCLEQDHMRFRWNDNKVRNSLDFAKTSHLSF